MKTFRVCFGLGALVSGYIIYSYTFIVSALNGGSVTIYTNHYGEQTIELIVQLFLLPFVILFLISFFKEG